MLVYYSHRIAGKYVVKWKFKGKQRKLYKVLFILIIFYINHIHLEEIMPKKTKVKPVAIVKKKMPTKARPQKLTAVKTPFTKSQLLQYIAENTELTKNKTAEVFELLNAAINAHLCKNSAGIFTLAGIAKFKVKHMPAQKARKGRNPFTGEEVMFKAKPARNVVKIRPLKKLKDNVA